MGIKTKNNMKKKELKFKIGDSISFESFKNKEMINGKILKLFIGKDSKEYCQVLFENKIYHKQTSKIKHDGN